MHLWPHLIEQAALTLNLLRASRRNPQVSAHSILEGNFNCDATPMAPPDTKVLIHDKPQKRGSWDPNGVEGWYLGPALQNYRCYHIFATKTKATRITNTVEFFPTNTKISCATPTDVAIQASHDIIKVLPQKKTSTPLAHIGNDQLEAIQQIADIFNSHIKKHEPVKHHKTNQPTPPKLPRVQAPRKQILPRVSANQTRSPTH
jgi:hypothetical protein